MAKKRSVVATNNRPAGVTVLSVLGYIGAAITLILGILALVAAPLFFSLMPAVEDLPWLAAIGTAVAVFLGIFFIVIAVIDYFIARGLWNGRNWARIVVLVFASLGALSSLVSLQIVSLIIDAIIIWYLGFEKGAKAYFR